MNYKVGLYSFLYKLDFKRTDYNSIINEYYSGVLGFPKNNTFDKKCEIIQKDFKKFRAYVLNKFI